MWRGMGRHRSASSRRRRPRRRRGGSTTRDPSTQRAGKERGAGVARRRGEIRQPLHPVSCFVVQAMRRWTRATGGSRSGALEHRAPGTRTGLGGAGGELTAVLPTRIGACSSRVAGRGDGRRERTVREPTAETVLSQAEDGVD